MFGGIFFAQPLQRSNLCASHRQAVAYLFELFTNLVVNAFEALEGRGCLTIRASFVPTEDGHALAGEPGETSGSVVIDVTDDGPGVPEDVSERIFSPFFTTKPRGSGLGLAIVRKIVDAHDGRIDVRSRDEGGTHVQVTVPVTQESTTPELVHVGPPTSGSDVNDALCGEHHIDR